MVTGDFAAALQEDPDVEQEPEAEEEEVAAAGLSQSETLINGTTPASCGLGMNQIDVMRQAAAAWAIFWRPFQLVQKLRLL